MTSPETTPADGAKHVPRKWLAGVRHALEPAAPLAADKSANELAEDRTHFATDRTMMAADRSLMAWIRTSLSMISFGFTIYKLLQSFQESGIDMARGSSPRTMGLFLTGLGTLAMVMGTIEYWLRLKELRQFKAYKTFRPSFVFAMVMSVTGLFLFIGIIAKAL
jgi:putative membrane protein